MTGSFIDDLNDIPGLNDLDKTSANPHKAIAKEKAAPTFPCESCHGTGKYRGVRIHQQEEKCFACKGKGYFKKSYADRMAARQKSAQRKADKLAVAKSEFEKAHPDLIAAVRAKLGWMDIAKSMLEQYDTKGTLSDRQVEVLEAQLDKQRQRDVERAQAKMIEAQKSVVDPSGIRTLFDGAKERGLKRPGLWFGKVKISEAPSHGRNAGALYVKYNKEYVGKISGSAFQAAWGLDREFKQEILDQLTAIAADPATVLREKGKETGTCCCCGRELTDPISIANGIGPICADNWGL